MRIRQKNPLLLTLLRVPDVCGFAGSRHHRPRIGFWQSGPVVPARASRRTVTVGCGPNPSSVHAFCSRVPAWALFDLPLILLLAAVVLTGLARRLDVPYPALLALAGAAVAFLPFAPEIAIEPDLALALFVAPVLLDAAFDTSPRDL